MKKSQLDAIVWFFMYLVLYVPLSCFYGLTNADSFWFIVVTSAWLCCNLFINSNVLSFQFSFPMLKRKWLLWGGILFGMSISMLILYKIDVNFSMSLTEVYELRASKPTQFLPFSDYIINTLAKVLLPLVILLALYYWNKTSVFILVIGIVSITVFYFSTGHKGMLFNIPFVLILYAFLRYKNYFSTLSILLFAGFSTIILYSVISNNNLFISLFYRRTLMSPAQLSFYYHEFFQNNYIYLSNSILSSFTHYPYVTQPSFEVANYFFNKPDMAASNGLLSDGFRHLGYIGVFIWLFTFVVLLKILKGFSKATAFPVVLTMALLFAKTVMDGPLLTTLLTHGFLFLFVILFLLKPDGSNTANG